MDCTLFFSKYNQQLALSSYKIIYISGVKSNKKYRSFLLHSFYIKYEKINEIQSAKCWEQLKNMYYDVTKISSLVIIFFMSYAPILLNIYFSGLFQKRFFVQS